MALLIIVPDTEISLSYDSQNTAITIKTSSINLFGFFFSPEQ